MSRFRPTTNHLTVFFIALTVLLVLLSQPARGNTYEQHLRTEHLAGIDYRTATLAVGSAGAAMAVCSTGPLCVAAVSAMAYALSHQDRTRAAWEYAARDLARSSTVSNGVSVRGGGFGGGGGAGGGR